MLPLAACVATAPWAPSLKKATVLTRSCAWVLRLLAAAAISSTRAAFCWVTWSICVTASPTWATPWLCSELAALISPIRSVTRLMAPTTSVIVAPA